MTTARSWTGPAAYRIRFESAGHTWAPREGFRLRMKEGATAFAMDRDRILEAFRRAVVANLHGNGCRSFTVSIHPDGADCDHEVG